MTRKLIYFFAYLGSVFLFYFAGCENARQGTPQLLSGGEIPVVAQKDEPQRIISTVPSVTETLFELGLGDRVVGVSEFCNYPESARSLPRTGGYLNPNFEAMIELSPDLVIVLAEAVELQNRLESFGIAYLAVDHKSIDGILDSLVQIGNRCGAKSAKRANELQTEINNQLDDIAKRTANLDKPKVVVTLYFDDDTVMQSATIVGNSPFFEQVFELAGGVNVAQNAKIAFPTISREGIMELNPDYIIGLADENANNPQTIENFNKNWGQFASRSPAVENRQLVLVAEDYALVPGPRFVLLVEKIAKILHSEKFYTVAR